MATEPEAVPMLRVVRGAPDDAELAALTAVVSALAAASGGGGSGPRRRSPWSDPHALLRRPIAHGPWAWHASGLPG